MKFQNLFFLKIVFFLLFFSCNNNDDDDDNSDDNPLAIRDAAEQAIVDDNILKSYLETHFYNYEDFSSAPNDYSISIKIDSLDESNDDKNPLINYVQEKEVIVKQDGIDIPQKLYYIIVREGKGVKPNNVDSTFVSYKGSLVNGFIFDGFPRTTEQANALDVFLKSIGTEVTKMVALNVPEKELVSRLLNRGKESGRTDDQDENIISNRIKVYEKNTAVLADFYDAQSKLENINGLGPVEQVTKRIYNAIDN